MQDFLARRVVDFVLITAFRCKCQLFMTCFSSHVPPPARVALQLACASTAVGILLFLLIFISRERARPC